jgi:hypothetical protein
MFHIVDNFSTLTHSSFFKLSWKFVKNLVLQEKHWQESLKVKLLEDSSIGDSAYLVYITLNKQENSSFLYPSSTMGCSLSCPSVRFTAPEGRRNMSAKISDDSSNSHRGTRKSISSTWLGWQWQGMNEVRLFQKVATDFEYNAIPIELCANVGGSGGHDRWWA